MRDPILQVMSTSIADLILSIEKYQAKQSEWNAPYHSIHINEVILTETISLHYTPNGSAIKKLVNRWRFKLCLTFHKFLL